MDFQDAHGSDGDSPEIRLTGENTLAAATAGRGQGLVLRPDANNVVVLPEGATLDDLAVQGRDIIITMPDGRVFVIPDGAVYVPQIVIGDVAVPPLNLAALLTGNEPQPAAGPLQSSGGNFADPTGPIQAAHGLGDLLPYTELSFAVQQDEEVLPDLVNEEPEIIIETPDNPAGAIDAIATVDEEGLPARGDEPAGTAAETDAETTTGTIVFSSPDGTSAVLINGEAITSTGQTFTSPFGTMTITSIDLAGGQIGFSYTLADNLVGETADGFFTMTVVDADGDEASATLQVNVVDDGPIGFADSNAVPAGTFGPVSGNVIDNDVSGADGFSGAGATAVTGFASATETGAAGATISGTYGQLTLNADGSYSYTRFFDTPGGVEDRFTYSIADGDGTAATGIELIITIGDSPPAIVSVPEIGDGTEVNENQLPSTTDTRSDEAPGSQFVSGPESTTGTITFHSSDGVSSVSIGGTVITPGALPQVVASDGTGTLTVVDYAYDSATGDGSVTYVYTLNDNTANTDGTTVSFDITVVDADEDSVSDTLDIHIIDDVPAAAGDTAVSVAEDAAAISGNVLVNDTQGADGATVTSVTIGGVVHAVAASGTTSVSTANGDYTFDAAGNWTFDPASGLDQSSGDVDASFSYTLTDGDGDTATASQPIAITDGAGPSAGDPVSLTVDDENLADGSNPSAPVSDSGDIVFTPGSDAIATIAFGTDLSGLDASLTWVRIDGSTIIGSDGDTPIITLTLTRTGDTASVTATLSDNYDAHPTFTADDLKALGSVDVIATDSDGDTATSSVSVSVSDDVPTAVGDMAVSVAEDAAAIGGNVLANDTQGADGATVTSVTIGGVVHAVAASGATSVSTANGDYTFDALGNWTFDPAPGLDQSGGDVDVSFSYTLTDGDGDTATASQPIAITDGAGPSAGDPVSLTVDDENLADGSNPSAPVSDSGDIVFTPGSDAIATIAFGTDLSGLDASLTWVRIDGSTIIGSDGDTPIVTLTLTRTGDTASVTATLSDNYDAHPTFTADDLKALGSVDVIATDSDGDTAASSVSVSVSDDVPTAASDIASQASENAAFTIDALGNDTFGADGVDTADTAKVFVSSQASQGTVTYDTATRLFTYTPDAGAGSTSTSDSFEYTIVDGDGDISTATVNVTLQPDSEPEGGERVARLDDDGLAGGNAASVTGDIDANDGDAPADTSEASFTGTVSFDVGNDTPATVTFDASLDGSTAMVGLETVTYSVSGAMLTATITGGARDGMPLFQVEILDSQTGEYQVTLLDNVLNAGGPNEEAQNAFASIDFTVTDSEGDTATTNLGIVFNDDAPTATDDTDSLSEDTASVGGNVLTNDAFGADGPHASLQISAVSGTAAGTVGGSTPGAYGTLQLDPGGTYTYTLNTAAVQGLDDGEQATDTFSYTITDADGDTSTAFLTITINGANDAPDAENDTNWVLDVTSGPNPTASGNVLQDIDHSGAPSGTFADVADTDVDVETLTVTGVAGGTVGNPLNGSHGSIVINGNGSYTYTLDASDSDVDALGAGETLTDSFTYTVSDGTTTDTATVTITIFGTNDAPVVTGSAVAVSEEGLNFGNPDDDPVSPDDADTTDSVTASGSITISDADTGDTHTVTLGTPTQTLYTPDGGTPLTWHLSLDGHTLTGYSTDFNSPEIVVTIDDSGNYDVTLGGPVLHVDPTTEDLTSFIVPVTVDDGTTSTTLTSGITVTIEDDSPIAVDDSEAVLEGGTTFGDVLLDAQIGGDSTAAAVHGTVTDVTSINLGTSDDTADPSGDFVLAGEFGTLTLNRNGSYTYQSTANGITDSDQDVFEFTMVDADGDPSTATLTIDVLAVTLVADNQTKQVDEAALDTVTDTGDLGHGTVTGSNPSSTAETVTGTLGVTGPTGTVTYVPQNVTTAFGIFDLNSDGTYTYTLTNPYTTTPDANDGAVVEPGVEEFTYTAQDVFGNSVTGTVTIDIKDDVPTATTPASISVTNTTGGTNTAYLDADLSVANNYGADGAGAVIFTAASITSLESQDLTSGLVSLEYAISSDGTVLTASKSSDGSLVFTIELQPGGSADQYVVTLAQKVDSTSTIDFNDGSYDFVGGNDPWAGFVPDGQDANQQGGVAVDDNSQDLLLTPFGGDGTSGNAINGNANSAGVTGGGGGQNIGTDEGIRLDYVTDLTGNPAGSPANYDGNGTQQDHQFDDHYQVNGASVRFGDGSTASTISIKAFDASDSTNLVYHNGTLVNVTQIVVSYDGENQAFIFDSSNLTQTLSVGSTGGLADRNYTVTWVESSPGSGDYYVQVTGILDTNVRIATHGETAYEAIEIQHISGDDFALTGFGAVTITNEPVDFTVPVSIQDGDGDTVSSGSLSVTLNPVAPPIALDLDGDGVEFVGLNAGVAYDYGSGLVQTAWVAPDDGLLAHDTGNGLDIVFTDDAAGAETDLEGLRLAYDSNGDGKFTAADAAFKDFGVWQDGNSNGIVDVGEFQSLLTMGITSIDLTSDGVGSTEAGGDVIVHGAGEFTMKGTTYSLADASFKTGERIDTRSTEIAAVSLAAAGFMAAQTAAAQPLPAEAVATIAAAFQTYEADMPEVRVVLPESARGTPPVTALEDQAGHDQAGTDSTPVTDASGEEAQPGLTEAVSHQDFAPEPLASSDDGSPLFGTTAISFGGSDSDLMQALLLAVQAKQAGTSGEEQAADLPAVREAMADSAGQTAVNALIDHFAGQEGSHDAAGAAPQVLDHALDVMLAGAGMEGLFSAGMAGEFDMAALAAAVETHAAHA